MLHVSCCTFVLFLKDAEMNGTFFGKNALTIAIVEPLTEVIRALRARNLPKVEKRFPGGPGPRGPGFGKGWIRSRTERL